MPEWVAFGVRCLRARLFNKPGRLHRPLGDMFTTVFPLLGRKRCRTRRNCSYCRARGAAAGLWRRALAQMSPAPCFQRVYLDSSPAAPPLFLLAPAAQGRVVAHAPAGQCAGPAGRRALPHAGPRRQASSRGLARLWVSVPRLILPPRPVSLILELEAAPAPSPTATPMPATTLPVRRACGFSRSHRTPSAHSHSQKLVLLCSACSTPLPWRISCLPAPTAGSPCSSSWPSP